MRRRQRIFNGGRRGNYLISLRAKRNIDEINNLEMLIDEAGLSYEDDEKVTTGKKLAKELGLNYNSYSVDDFLAMNYHFDEMYEKIEHIRTFAITLPHPNSIRYMLDGIENAKNAPNLIEAIMAINKVYIDGAPSFANSSGKQNKH